MAIYWVMFFLPACVALLPMRSHAMADDLTWKVTTSFFILAVGLRFEVGGDWVPYLLRFQEAVGASVTDAVELRNDPGYGLINWIMAQSGWGVWTINMFCAVLSVGGIMALAKRQPLPWVAVGVSVPYMLVVVAMGYMRQAAALGLICWALIAITDHKPLKFLLLTAVAATIHKSAVVAMPLYLLALPKLKIRHWFLLVGMLALIAAALIMETLEAQWYSYVEQQKDSEGALLRVAMNLPPALLILMFKKRLGLNDRDSRHWWWMALIAIPCVFLVTYASTAVDRMALYLLPIQMIACTRLQRFFTRGVARMAMPVLVLIIYGTVQFVWLNYAKHAEDWIPYEVYQFR